MSIDRIDHIVIAVADLDRTIADYRALGFTVFPGGEHPGGYSHNALVIFEDGSYFELIAFKKERPGWRWWELFQAYGEGLSDYALLPSEVERDYDAVRARGLDLEGPTAGGRTRLDGQQVAWKTARGFTTDLPFLCGDVTPRSLRVPEGDIRHHANGVVGVAGMTIAVADLATSVVRYKALLNAEPRLQTGLPGLGGNLAVFQLGSAHVILASPVSDTHPGSLAETLRAQLSTRGEGPYAVALRTTDQSGAGVLDPSLAHSTGLELVFSS